MLRYTLRQVEYAVAIWDHGSVAAASAHLGVAQPTLSASLAKLEELDPVSYGELRQVMHTLEMHYRDMCDIEFTIEKGRLWILQTRVGKRTAGAAFRIAVQLGA